jgi:uncharacterized membrane protein (UPF0127 family)
MTAISRTLSLGIAFCLLSACATAGSDSWVELKGKRFIVEVADDDAERARGLMFRDELADGHGMVFLHDEEAPQSYWMKNTRIPLDILFFDHSRKLVSAQQRVPPCSLGDGCPPFRSEVPALYVLELNAGVAESLGVKAGDELTFGPGITSKK